ncbi:MAG: hypothetical protein ACE5GU_12990 [Candidatus Scalinduaceae bacterium]
MRGSSDYLFTEYDLYSTLQNNLERAKREVDMIPENQFLHNDDDTLTEHVFSKMEILHIELFEDDKEMEQQETQIDVSHDIMRGVFDRSRPCLIPGLQITVSIPFTGDTNLWKCKPSTYTLNPPRAQVQTDYRDTNRGHLNLVFRKPSDTVGDGQAIRNELCTAIRDIQTWLGYIRKDVEAHNKQLESTIRQAISARRDRLKTHGKVLEALDIPLKKKAGAPDMRPLPIRRKVVKPLESKPNVPPEPGINNEVYEDILGIIRHEGRTFESTPNTYNVHDEEGLRDIILAHLNGYYPGEATGETFRKKGKTDICIEDNNRAAFVAECKLWKGEKAIQEAVDQLLGYLVWRDCKTSLIVFNKSVSGFAKIQEKLPESLKAHPNFIKEVRLGEHGEWRYVFEAEDDEDRHITLHVFLFNLYVKKL